MFERIPIRCSENWLLDLAKSLYDKTSGHFQNIRGKRKPDAANDQPSVSKFFFQCNEATLSQTRKIAIAFCSARHSLPLNFYEDKCNEWALGVKLPRDKLRREIENSYTDVKETVMKNLEGRHVCVTFDGRTNCSSERSSRKIHQKW